MRRSVLVAVVGAACVTAAGGAESGVVVAVRDEVVQTVPDGFLALHYDGPTHRGWDGVARKVVAMPGAYGSPYCREALRAVGVQSARIFVKLQQAHPKPGEFDWAKTDTAVEQTLGSGLAVMLCLRQGAGAWFVGDAKRPWWTFDGARAEWREFARRAAARYGGKARWFEVLNEPNHIHPDKPDYMGWDTSVDLFLEAADAIRAAVPDARVGGSATWAAWESAEWGKRVLARPGAEQRLDFVSYHIYTSHSLADADARILGKTPWFEQAPVYIREQLGSLTRKPIAVMLTEFNASAVFSKDGKPFTDPRNVNAFGGVLTCLALLHSARGRCDVATHFGTTGGFGLIRWPPEFVRRAPWHAMRLLRDAAGLAPGAAVLRTTTTEPAKHVKGCVRATWPTHDLAPFALRGPKGLAVVLVNKRADAAIRARVELPAGWRASRARLFRFSATRVADAPYALAAPPVRDGACEASCAPLSVTVLQFAR